MFLDVPNLLVTAARKTGDTARGLIVNLYEGTNLNTIVIYCGVLIILAIIASSLIIAFAAAAKKKADLYYLTQLERVDWLDHLHRSVR